MQMNADAIAELADPSVLRVAMNMGNKLLTSGLDERGVPQGVGPDVLRSVAAALGLRSDILPFAMPGDIIDAAAAGSWDLAQMAFEPKRAELVDFTASFVEVAATYLVAPGSDFQAPAELDQPGVRIAVPARAGYDHFLTRNLRHATLHRGANHRAAFELFVAEGLEAFAGLAPALGAYAKEYPGSRILPGSFTTMGQAVATRPGHPALHAFAGQVIADLKTSGEIAEIVARHGMAGKLQVPSS
ncbi:MAG: transporter substrate-binding domain-containing protein [Rhodospirillales bacterium]